MQILDSADWLERRARHECRVNSWISPHLDRSSRGEVHPVLDFLFDYYSYRPSHLLRWHPGIGVALRGREAAVYLQFREYEAHPSGISASPASWKPDRFRFVKWLQNLQQSLLERPPFFGCCGLHEWAMVYRTPNVRHPHLPLRFPHSEIDSIVDASSIRCSHFDAFRFFTPAATPLNKLQPTRDGIPFMEQPGCLHANMDLYKWAYKLAPFASSDLVADAFALAAEIREVDMRASPYDLSAYGLTPIRIETAEGRSEYELLQRSFTQRAHPLRHRILAVCEALLQSTRANSTPH